MCKNITWETETDLINIYYSHGNKEELSEQVITKSTLNDAKLKLQENENTVLKLLDTNEQKDK